MAELNELTRRLLSEGWKPEDTPPGMDSYKEYDGGWTYSSKTMYSLVFETPCGLLVKGEHFTRGYMAWRGVNWRAENNNPVVCCPRFDLDFCAMRHPLLWGEEYRLHEAVRQCACHLTDRPYTFEHSPNGQFTKETDIMDVWFDSGSSHQGVLAERDYLTYPADLYLEGSDQYRGWFNSSLITSVVCSGHAPYKEIVSQGFTLDKRGDKMSKSQGNVIDPNKVVQQMGAEIIRLWVMSADTSADVRVSMGTFQQISEAYRKLRNTFRFLLANTSDFDPEENAGRF